MSLGTLFSFQNGERLQMDPLEVSVTGQLMGSVASFTVRQTFKSEESVSNMSYLVSDNGNLCMYDTTFYVGKEVIRPELQPRQQAKIIYTEAQADGRAALLAQNLGNGIIEFKLGNIPAGVQVAVEVKVCCSCKASNPSSGQMFVKFPLDVCTPSGRVGCLMSRIQKQFKFTFDCSSAGERIKNVTCNSRNGVYNKKTQVLSISKKDDHFDAVIITMEFAKPLSDNFDVAGTYLALNFYGHGLEDRLDLCQETNNEFVFVVDCSDSMWGDRLLKARQCLDLFIRSLPIGCYFNIISFGSSYDMLFKRSTKLDERSFAKAVKYGDNLQANLGCTEILKVLRHLFRLKRVGSGERCIFLMTDGEVYNLEEILSLTRTVCGQNRIFTLGIGSGADPGVVEGLASITGGSCDFVFDGENFANKVIPQLEASMKPSLTNVNIHIEGHERMRCSMEPLPKLPIGAHVNVVMKSEKAFTGHEALLLTGDFGSLKSVDVPVSSSCHFGKPFAKILEVLFMYSRISQLESLYLNSSSEDPALSNEIVSLSISSGILSKLTAFVGFSNTKYEPEPRIERQPSFCDFAIDGDARCVSFSGSLLEDEDHSSSVLSVTVITRLQNINGYWTDVKSIVDALGKVPVMPKAIAGIKSHKERKQRAFNTAYALAVLRHKFMDDHASWKLIEQKALAWLESTDKTTDWEVVIQEMMARL